MNLRDYFAAKALTGLLSRPGGGPEYLVCAAYELADAMLKEREKIKDSEQLEEALDEQD